MGGDGGGPDVLPAKRPRRGLHPLGAAQIEQKRSLTRGLRRLPTLRPLGQCWLQTNDSMAMCCPDCHLGDGYGATMVCNNLDVAI